jgi:cation-transporting P-type ATPase E
VGIPGLIGLDALPYPFLPRHVTITGWFTIGLPAFVLALAPNAERARPGFVGRVMRIALPAGVVIAASCFVSYLLANPGKGAAPEDMVQASTAALITLISMALFVLASIARPYAWWKVVLVTVMVVASALMFLTPLTRRIFLLDPTAGDTLTALACAAVGVVIIQLAWWAERRFGRRASPTASRAVS